ncbi:MAG: hypothetical protein V4515_15135 [Chloroflexota bacterium]
MSREVRRVPLDFDFPIGETWSGYLRPDSLDEEPCGPCGGTGYSVFARRQHDRWYGYVPFDPAETGSGRLTPETPQVRAFAERNVAQGNGYYGVGEAAIVREAVRLCRLWNGMWSHHPHQDDVDALVAEGRLMDFTHTWVQGDGWHPIVPPPSVAAERVNLWSIGGFGHDAINQSIVLRALCERESQPLRCGRCEGHASTERYPGQRAEAEVWEGTDPPPGEGYQLWQTVSEGGPVSPVFATPEELADWIIVSGSRNDGSGTPRDALVRWVAEEGHSFGSFAIFPGVGIVSGVELAAGEAS